MAKRPITTQQGEEEIIEKKPTAPMASTLLIISFVVLVVGIYINWEALTRMYFDKGLHEKGVDAIQEYEKWRKNSKNPVEGTNQTPEAAGIEQPAQ